MKSFLVPIRRAVLLPLLFFLKVNTSVERSLRLEESRVKEKRRVGGKYATLSLITFRLSLSLLLDIPVQQRYNKMATLRMMPLARHLQARLPSSWLSISARSITTSQTLVPPQASTSTAEADPAAIPSAQDRRTASASPSSPQKKLPYFITRTERNQSLPVYSNIRSGGTRQEVLIRHVSGNMKVGSSQLFGRPQSG